MESTWIKDNRRPPIVRTFPDNWAKSKKVLALDLDGDIIVVEYNKGTHPNGEEWEQWYCPTYKDIVDIIGWCDCIPDN